MVNPAGPAPEEETVALVNTSAAAPGRSQRLVPLRPAETPTGPAAERLALGDTLVVPAHNGFRLGDQGGAITCWTRPAF
ncbi:hypothetical protein [Streptomyces sp. NPDC059649]|uniref:hypothetical protein n=1 Tax=Streptomyces sp. NPDC059649 TaxID=3346895 RepID=UPI0036C74FD3